MARITLEKVDKIYANGFIAARDLSLDIADGEFLVLVGPSGSGKSTVLRMIAGLETVTKGTIRIGDRDVTQLSPQQRDVAMVFQNYALYPHMTVRENLGFGLTIRKQPPVVIEDRVRAVAASLGLEGLLDRRPAQLSGGQRQRVALGRAIAREPLAFLFDEPLSNLDAQLRVETRVELARLHRQLRSTMVYVTHDQAEALTLGDRIAVLKDGILQQVAAPMELYDRPANRFVARFIGSPAMNFFEGTLTREGPACRFTTTDLSVDIRCDPGVQDGSMVLGVRPQDISIALDGEGDIRGEVAVVEPMGSEQVVYAILPSGSRVIAVVPAAPIVKAGEPISMRVRGEAGHLFDSESGNRLN